ncbi:hypothetical protein CAL29_14935 [Bordetella genomosp. 10]|uniref:Uncharacterized protein n=1 Tax=Bordetella genomosp. 10 TaxID=1416804 RepID=A0A261SCQ5_9BORD|nr:tetratricopeptide repeat protein [Bordetella genomosp. 10]OZI34762.1 hypothetical protein CAL29_14935 [Bordetella genomosp. 10]
MVETGTAAAPDAAIDAEPAGQEAPHQARARLLRAIEAINQGDQAEGIAMLTPDLVRAAQGRPDLRRHVVSPLIRDGALDAAIRVLRILACAYPALADDHRLLASLLGRLKCWDEAIGHIDLAAAVQPADAALHAARIRLRLMAGRAREAGDIARDTAGQALEAPAEAGIWLTALLRAGDAEAAARVARGMDPARYADARTAAAAVRALLAVDDAPTALAAGQAALAAGQDGAALRAQLAQACLAGPGAAERHAQALAHMEAGLRLAPDDVSLNALYGEALLRAGRYDAAADALAGVCERQPGLEHVRALYARALRHTGRHAEAAEQTLKLVHAVPGRLDWHRQAAAALTQAGRAAEADALFDAFIQRRAAALPASFRQGLDDLARRADGVRIPQARLDWAWGMRRGAGSADRAQWERAARWGNLVDHLMLDWLECRDDRADEAMALLDDLDAAESFLRPLLAEGRGIVVATAHVGPMYAGPMVLELLGVRARWLASTPSVARTGYAASLISTSDQTEVQVAKASFKALQQGYMVGLAVDGAPTPAAPRIPFEGQEITYSSFAARAAFRTGAPSFFYAPAWKDGRIALHMEMLPRPEPGEDVGRYATRWRHAYLAVLREYLGGPPENLRLSGGLWRHIR